MGEVSLYCAVWRHQEGGGADRAEAFPAAFDLHQPVAAPLHQRPQPVDDTTSISQIVFVPWVSSHRVYLSTTFRESTPTLVHNQHRHALRPLLFLGGQLGSVR